MGSLKMVPAGILVLSLGFTALGEEAGDWVYDGGSEECEGDRQSPTNIPRTGLPAIEFPPLEFDHYSSAPEIMVVKNTGYVVELSFAPFSPTVVPTLSGGGLAHTYNLAKVIFHWGEMAGEGSEHTKSYTTYPMEVQMVHYKEKLGDWDKALTSLDWDSIAIVSTFFYLELEQRISNPTMDIIANAIQNITQPNTEIRVKSIPLSTFLPDNLDRFYRYNGSFTQPPCTENVVWTVLARPKVLLVEQLVKFAKLLNKEKRFLVNNVRPLQPLGNRTILAAQALSLKANSESLVASDQSSRKFNLIYLVFIYLCISMS